MTKVKNSKKLLFKKKPEKRLLLTLKRKVGRGAGGRISVRHKGGGAKKRYRIVDFGQEKMGIPAKVIAIEYDPNRSAFIMLLEYQGDGQKRYRICPQGLKIGDEIICSETAEIKTGNRLKLKNIPIGTYIYNVEIEIGRGGVLCRGAGTSAKVLAQPVKDNSGISKEEKYVEIVMPSSEVRKILKNCFASIGQVSFPEHRFVILGKAGRVRHKGIRPTVRGSAMNPVDHPHGGGEGRTGIGLKYPKTPWGRPALGVKTRKRKNTDKYIIKRRKKKKK